MRFGLAIGCLACGFLCLPVQAQTITATLTGAILDPAGAVVPDTHVSVTNTANDFTRTIFSNSSGTYVVTNLLPGHYRIVAEHGGFQRAVISDIELLVDQTAHLDIHLQLGQTTESVIVNAAAPVLDSETSSVSSVVDPHQMLNLPLNGRNFYDLVQLSPGVSPQMPNSFVAGKR